MRGPIFSLDDAMAAIEEGRVHLTSRPTRWLANHGYFDAHEVIAGVFGSMGPSYYLKTDELRAIPGTYADIYHLVPWDGEEWYVKFFFREGGEMQLEVWSLNWEGAIH